MTNQIDAVFRMMLDLTMDPFEDFGSASKPTQELVATTRLVARLEPTLVAGAGWSACDIFADTGADDHELPFPEEDEEVRPSSKALEADAAARLHGSVEQRAVRTRSDSLAGVHGVAR